MSAGDIAEEREIIRQCLDGEPDQYALLVDRYKSMAYNVAYRILGEEDTAKDMAQEGFISAYTSLEAFQYGSRFSSWLYRIVVNKCKDHLKTAREAAPLDDFSEIIPSREGTPEKAASARQEGAALRRALCTLPAEYRDVLVMKHVEGLDYGEISDVLGVGVNALKVRAHRGREMLRKLLKGLEAGV